jgi:menaquinone-9 beta-reductase
MTGTIVIVGAGPAGSIAAMLLARGGADVTLVEQQAFPRDKVCGECLSATGYAVLRRAGLADRLRAAGAVELGRTILHDADGLAVTLELPQPCWGVSRLAMDTLFLASARDAGARVIQPARCEGIHEGHAEGSRAGVVVRELATNRVVELPADYVLLADGKSALVAGRPAPTADLGVKARFEAVDGPRDAVELFTLKGHYVGLNPIEGGRWNLAMSVPAERVRAHGGDLQAVFETTLEENEALRRRLGGATRVSEWLAAPLPRFGVQVDRWPRGVIPIGNAAAALEPIGGEGMGLAMRSAEMAAEAILAHHALACHGDRPFSFAQLSARFRRLWRARRVSCRAAAMILSRPSLAAAALPVLDATPALQGAVLGMIGKSSAA